MKLAMTIGEALEFADNWIQGVTLHEDSQGWRVVCMLLAEEVRKLRAQAQQTTEPETGAAGWQPIETAPKDGTKILAYTNDGYKYPLVCQCVFGEGEWWPDVWESPDEPLHPTYWMPLLPTPPKG